MGKKSCLQRIQDLSIWQSEIPSTVGWRKEAEEDHKQPKLSTQYRGWWILFGARIYNCCQDIWKNIANTDALRRKGMRAYTTVSYQDLTLEESGQLGRKSIVRTEVICMPFALLCLSIVLLSLFLSHDLSQISINILQHFFLFYYYSFKDNFCSFSDFNSFSRTWNMKICFHFTCNGKFVLSCVNIVHHIVGTWQFLVQTKFVVWNWHLFVLYSIFPIWNGLFQARY